MDGLRAGDADRDRTAQQLQEHHLAGRLDAAELEERVGRAYASTELAELESLTADLPGTSTVVAAPRLGPPGVREFVQEHDVGVPPEQAYAEALDLVTGAMAGYGYRLVEADPARALVFERTERDPWVALAGLERFPFGGRAPRTRTLRLRVAFLRMAGGGCRLRISGRGRRAVRKAFLQLGEG